ncbi:hypothetical protein Q0M92_14175, partial [Staphylococcus aureus]|nr:hypothetical protein [Staphylococcus aureus]
MDDEDSADEADVVRVRALVGDVGETGRLSSAQEGGVAGGRGEAVGTWDGVAGLVTSGVGTSDEPEADVEDDAL